MIKPSTPNKKPTALRGEPESPEKDNDSGYCMIVLVLAAVLGISIALNFIAFYYLF